jgi:hypothetical protein
MQINPIFVVATLMFACYGYLQNDVYALYWMAFGFLIWFVKTLFGWKFLVGSDKYKAE